MTVQGKIGNNRGFTLVELLIVVAIMGLVMMSIISLYQSTQRSAYTQEEVVEVQQNLRVAMDQIARDIRMAGFMIPSDDYPISNAPPYLCRDLNDDGDCADTDESYDFILQAASPLGRIARVGQDFPIPDPLTTDVDFPVALAGMSDLFEAASPAQVVRVIRPPDHNDLFGHTLQVAGKSRTVPNISLTGFVTGDDEGVQVKAGDVIVRVASGASHPGTITYSLSIDDGLLQRNDGVNTQDVAGGITDLAFRYLLDDDNTRYTSVTGSTLDDIKAVEVTITGQASTLEGTKTREITNVVTIRNR